MKILIFPVANNPYQPLLYKEMDEWIEIKYLAAPGHNPLRVLFYLPYILFSLLVNRFSANLLHIHWMYPFRLPLKVPLSRRIAYINSLTFLYFAKALGYRIIWTVHNVLPHEQLTSNDLKIRRKLSLLATTKIIHSKSTLKEMKRFGINTSNCTVIPHGNYIDVYPNTLSKVKARQLLQIPSTAQVLVFFGRIETYKNIPVLLDAYKELAEKQKDLYLLIAGQCFDSELRHLLNHAVAHGKGRISLHDHYVDDKDVQLYFNAADICVYPFKEITTSGSVLLAASFGKPIIAPHMGALTDLPPQIGQFYDPSDKHALEKSISVALRDDKKQKKMASASLVYAKTLSWAKIARQTQKVYESASS